MNFNELKEDVLSRAKNCHACEPEYKRALRAETREELLQVIADNIIWAYKEKMLNTPYMIEHFEDLFPDVGIYTSGHHEISEGAIILLGSSSANVKTWDSSSANVKTLDSSSANVETLDSSSANVETLGSSSANVKTLDSSSANVKTWGSSSIKYELKGDYSTIKDLSKLKLFIKRNKLEVIQVD